MRFYTEEEIASQVKLFNEEYFKEQSFPGIKLSPALSEDVL
jgi:hypothetical protein